jgi:transposase
MRKIREILRLKWVLGKSHRDTAKSLRVSAGTVAGAVSRARYATLSWEQVEALSDEELETRLYGTPGNAGRKRPMPDLAQIHIELRRPGVTLELLHVEYAQKHPGGYGYTRFCELYRDWRKHRRLSMRQVHRAGEKLFVDYSGKKPCIIDPKSGEVHEVELFVAVLGASNYTYAEATRTQKSADWIASHIRALEFLGGVPGALVPDQLKRVSPKRAATNQRRSAPTTSWPRTTARRSSPHDRASLATRPKSK